MLKLMKDKCRRQNAGASCTLLVQLWSGQVCHL